MIRLSTQGLVADELHSGPDLLLIHREFNSIRRRTRAEVIHARLQALLPSIKVHRGQFRSIGLGHEDIEGLGLVDEGATVGGHVDERPLFNLPYGLVKLLELGRNLRNALNASVFGDNVVFNVLRPQAKSHQVA